jgi:hypothetical protein
MSATVVGSLPLVEQEMVSLVLAHHEVLWSVVVTISIEVMNHGAVG